MSSPNLEIEVILASEKLCFLVSPECSRLCFVLLPNKEEGELQATRQKTESKETKEGSGTVVKGVTYGGSRM